MYGIIGKALIFIIVISCVLIYLSLYIGRKEQIIANETIYKAAETVLDFFFKPLLSIYISIFDNPEKLYSYIVNVKNAAHKNKFIQTKKRIIIAPHCMRHINCPAFSTEKGIQCKMCGLCVFTEMKEIAEIYNYRLYIITGSSFVKHILTSEESKDIKGILAIGCNYEINKGMRELKKYKHISTYGFPILNTGCYDTHINFEKFKNVVESLKAPDET